MTSAETSTEKTAAPPVRGGRIWGVGLAATAAAIVLNLIVGLGLRAALDVSGEFLPLTPGAIVFFTLIPSVLGIALYQILRAVTRRPNVVFTAVVGVLAVLSLVAPLGLLGADEADWPGLTTGAALALVPLHLLPAVVLVAVLTRLDRR